MLQLGRITIHTLNDGFFAMDGGAMFGVVPKPLWSKEVPADAENRIPMSLHCPLATDGRDTILIDTGLGDRLSERETEIYKADRRGGVAARLHEIGLEPEDVTHVVLTHLHFDHLGGVVFRDGSGRAKPRFPRARHFVQRRELDAALAPGDEREKAAYRHVSECLEPLREARLLEVLEGDTSITPRLRVVVTGGHTATHQCPILSDGGETFLHAGDIAPSRAHLRPAWNQAYDVDPLGTIAAKKRLLGEAARDGWWVSFDHDHRVACARLGEGWAKGEVLDAVTLSSQFTRRMDGVHDLGGMHGFGVIDREANEPVFHSDWERRVFAMTLCAMGNGVANLDEFRHAVERMSPAHYLASTYYEHWLDALERVLVEKGVVRSEDIEARCRELPPQPAGIQRSDPVLAEALMAGMAQGLSSRRETGRRPRFRRGARVVVRNDHPSGHTRCPRYVRGAEGVVERVWGSFVLPDRSAHGKSEVAEPCYCVRFDARDLWGEERSGESIYVDLWESYLEPAKRSRRKSE